MQWVIEDVKRVLTSSYTAIAFYALTALIILPDIIFYGLGLDTNPKVWSCLMLLTCVFGLIGRITLQPKINKWRRRLIIIALAFFIAAASIPAMACQPDMKSDIDFELSLTRDLVIEFEGEHKIGQFHVGYLDIVDVPTICHGHTETAIVGHRKTDDQCAKLLTKDLTLYREGIRANFTPITKQFRVTPHRGAAFTSLTYNIGIHAARRSTATRRLNRGDIKGSCIALTWWNRAGGRVVRGLVRRRKQEQAYCMIGAT